MSDKKLEPVPKGIEFDSNFDALLYSIAVSLKRIADGMEKPVFRVNTGPDFNRNQQ